MRDYTDKLTTSYIEIREINIVEIFSSLMSYHYWLVSFLTYVF